MPRSHQDLIAWASSGLAAAAIVWLGYATANIHSDSLLDGLWLLLPGLLLLVGLTNLGIRDSDALAFGCLFGVNWILWTLFARVAVVPVVSLLVQRLRQAFEPPDL